jgi:hypothetical protein
MSIIISDESGIEFLKDYDKEYSIYIVVGRNSGIEDLLKSNELNISGLYINNTDNLSDIQFKRTVAKELKSLDHIVLCIDKDVKARDKYKAFGIKSAHSSQLYNGILKNIFVTDLFSLS